MRGIYRIAGHGADCCLRLYADTPEEVFLLAARAVVATSHRRLSTGSKCRSYRKEVSLESRDLAGMLVAWVDELIFTAETTGHPWMGLGVTLVPRRRGLQLHGQLVQLSGPWVSPLKAATLHDLRFEQRGPRWHAQVVCDL